MNRHQPLFLLSLSLLSFLFLGLSFQLDAQEKPYVYGRVTDASGQGIVGVNIINLSEAGVGTVTDISGGYQLFVNPETLINLQYTFVGFLPEERSMYLKNGEFREVNVSMLQNDQYLPDLTVKSGRVRPSTIQTLDKKSIEVLPNPSGSLEAILRTLPGVTGNNELSSQYSVRGGNFDENLVYVNDFEIYRPFLIRSGQQEGLSFVNPDLVQNIGFSAGGFAAKYGDKMSSVLDVKYKKPKDTRGSIGLSLLGLTSHLEGINKRKNLTYVMGVRYKTNQYLLNALPTQGQYSPSFVDFQGFFTYKLNTNWEIQAIGNYSRNNFQFIPVSSETGFGTFNEALRLTIFFDGQEKDNYSTLMGGLATVYNSDNQKLTLKLLGSGFQTKETEAFDIIGQYWIDEVENNLGEQDNFGQAVKRLGVGTYHDWARNELQAQIVNAAHRGYYDANKHFLSWGIKWQNEQIEDKLNEWYRLDSSGYTLPLNPNELALTEVLKTDLNLESNRFMGFVQDEWAIGTESQFNVTLGTRFNYWDLNEELLISPRAQLAWHPILKNDTTGIKSALAEPYDKTNRKAQKQRNKLATQLVNRPNRDLILRLSGGLYQQPAFYREMRAYDGTLNTNLLAQKSAHAVLGAEYSFNIWGRPFKLTTEAYYKHLWDLVPYDLDNMLIRYFGQNEATGYAAGIDMRLNGEFVPGTDSWVSLSVMQTKENLKNDSYNLYYNEAGETIGTTPTTEAVDSSSVSIGSLFRPTDQRVNFALFFQDYLPNNENFKMHLMLVFGSGQPYSPGENPRLRNVFRLPPYRRVDIGFSALLFDKLKKGENLPERSPMRAFRSIWASLEIFNLLGVKNTISHTYIKALDPGLQQELVYAVPNFLTSRRINFRLLVKF